jgi:hypothetical protein
VVSKRKPIGGLGHYVLDADGRTPLLEENFMEWARWFETSGEARRVARTEVAGVGHISTVFLGLDHGFHEPRPVLFETMSFLGLEHEDYFNRYCTWDEALAGHWVIVAKVITDIEHTAAMVADALVPGD